MLTTPTKTYTHKEKRALNKCLKMWHKYNKRHSGKTHVGVPVAYARWYLRVLTYDNRTKPPKRPEW